MPNRILFLVSAMFVSLALSSLALSLLPGAAYAADDCLTSPTKGTPAGGHWRYHLERGTARKCWYLATESAAKADAAKADASKADASKADATKAEEVTRDNATAADADDSNIDTTSSVPPRPARKIAPTLESAAASPPQRPRAAKPTPTPSPPALLGPANNARAEFIDTPRDTQPASSPAQPDTPQAAAPDTNAQQGSLATRWPSAGAAPAADNNSVAATSAAPAPTAQPAAAEPQPTVDQPAPADQATPTAQPADPAEGPDYLLYALIVFTCAFAAVSGFAGLRFLLDWWRDWREETRWRQSEQTYAGYRERSMTAMDEIPMDHDPADDAPMPWASTQRPFAPEPSQPRIEEEIDRIEQLLAMTRQSTPATQPSMFEAHAPRDAAE